jgi:hypothetical protein
MPLSTQKNKGTPTFTNLTDLRAFSGENLSAGDPVFYAPTGNLVAATVYHWNTTSTESDTGGTVIKLDDTATGRLEYASGLYNQGGVGAVDTTQEEYNQRVINVFDFLTDLQKVDVLTRTMSIDCREAVQAASDEAAGKSLCFRPGSYYVSNPGVTLNGDGHNWYSEGEVVLACERTYFVDQGGGVFTVGQGNVINANGVNGVSLKNITIKGSYEASWGNQSVYANNTPDGSGSKLLFLKDCNDVILDGFRIVDSYASYSPTANEQTSVYGWNQILITGGDNIQLTNCSWTDSVGEAWHIYNCNNVYVDGCNFTCDYGVSFLDITYCTHVRVLNSSFIKTLESDSGDLLNVPSSDVAITGNTLTNGNIDIGNEYLNRGITLGQSFVCRNIVVDSNTITNGFIQWGTTDDTFTPTWAHEDVVVSNNAITIDLDTRPAANGTTVLNYSAITLPQYKDSRNISISNNSILLKGALQTGGTPSNLNNVRLINSITDTTGFTRKNFSIEANTITADFSNYDSDNLNSLGGAIVIQRGIWEDLSIEGNVIDCPLGIMIDREESMNRTSIKNNSVRAETFLNMPFTTDTDIDGMDINDNSFVFLNTSGHTYDSTDVDSKGFGAFLNLWPGADSDILKLQIKNNNVQAVVFTFLSNFNTTTHVQADGVISDNTVEFVDFLAGSPTIYPFRFGRVTAETAPSTLHLKDNYFSESSASTVACTALDIKALDLIANQFIGTFSLTITTDNISGVSDSRLTMKNNLADTALTVTYGNMTTAVLQEISENSTNYSFGGFSKINGMTVASLPSASTAGAGAKMFVTDANATTFASTVAGGGSNDVPVYSDGTNWKIG